MHIEVGKKSFPRLSKCYSTDTVIRVDLCWVFHIILKRLEFNDHFPFFSLSLTTAATKADTQTVGVDLEDAIPAACNTSQHIHVVGLCERRNLPTNNQSPWETWHHKKIRRGGRLFRKADRWAGLWRLLEANLGANGDYGILPHVANQHEFPSVFGSLLLLCLNEFKNDSSVLKLKINAIRSSLSQMKFSFIFDQNRFRIWNRPSMSLLLSLV